MNALRARLSGHFEDLGGIQIALRRVRRSDQMGLICKLHMKAICVGN